MLNTIITIVINALLNWVKSLVQYRMELEKARAEGRTEVQASIEKKQEEIKDAVEVLRNTDTTFDESIRRMRERNNSNNK